jgi:hypothetical protein
MFDEDSAELQLLVTTKRAELTWDVPTWDIDGTNVDCTVSLESLY